MAKRTVNMRDEEVRSCKLWGFHGGEDLSSWLWCCEALW